LFKIFCSENQTNNCEDGCGEPSDREVAYPDGSGELSSQMIGLIFTRLRVRHKVHGQLFNKGFCLIIEAASSLQTRKI